MKDNTKKAADIASEQSERDTPLRGIELPDDATEAGMLIENLTREMKAPPFWCPREGWLRGPKLPEGVRAFPEVALVIIEGSLWKQGIVKLKYHDGDTVLVDMKHMALGVMLRPSEVEQQYVVAVEGHFNLLRKRVGR